MVWEDTSFRRIPAEFSTQNLDSSTLDLRNTSTEINSCGSERLLIWDECKSVRLSKIGLW